MNRSQLWDLDWRDAFKSSITAILTAVATALAAAIDHKVGSNDFTFTLLDLKLVLSVALFTFVGDICHRFISDHDGKVVGKY